MTDVVVIGSGIGGLCCAALLAKDGHGVTVCEGYVTAGGAAHGYERDGYHFDSGPSFFTCLTAEITSNPLRAMGFLTAAGFVVPGYSCSKPAIRRSMTDCGATRLSTLNPFARSIGTRKGFFFAVMTS